MRLFRFVMPLVLLAVAIFLVTAGCRRDGGADAGPSGEPASDEAVLYGRVQAASATVNSTVRAADGDLLPIAGADVWIENLPYFPHRITNASGEYIFESIPLGTHRLVASFSSRVSGKPLKTRSDIRVMAAGQPGEIPPMVLLAATKGVSGTLRDTAGTPLAAGTKIVIWGEVITLPSGGGFTCPPLPALETRTDLSVLLPSASTSPTSRPASATVTIPLALLETRLQIDVTVPLGSETASGAAGLNHPPVVNLAVAKSILQTGEQISCTADATDPDPADQGTALTVSWRVSAGMIAQSPADALAATFTAPMTTGLATISVMVADARGATSTTSLRVTVSETPDGNGSDTANPDDVTPPSVVLSSTAGTVTNAAIPLTVTFSEPVIGFDLAKLTIGNGTAGNLQQITANRVYTCVVVPVTAGIVTVDLAAGMVADAAGNRNLAATRLTRTYGANAPAAVLSSTASATTNTVIPLTITFSEDIIGFYLSKLTIRNGLASDRRMTTPNRVFTCLVTPTAPGTVTVDLEAGKVVNVSGNGNIAAAQFLRFYDARPTVVLSTPAPVNTNRPIPLTIDFSERVYGFDLTKLSIGNGVAGELRTVAENRFSCIVTPAVPGTVTIDLAAGMVVDSAGSTNTAARRILRMFDDVAPTVTLSALTPYTTNATIPLKITFSEGVVGFGLSKLVIENGTASDLQASMANRVYMCTITPGVAGDVKVDLPADSVTDPSGNGNITATQFSRIYDNIAPDNQNTVLAADWLVKGNEVIEIVSSGDAYNTIWLAPAGTKVFVQGEAMTRTSGEATTTQAPSREGVYRLFVVDMAGNVSSGSLSIVTVDNTAPSNQNTVLAADRWVRPGVSVPIVSSGDTGNIVWLAPFGTSLFYESSNMTHAGGAATSISAPVDEGNYRLYIIDSVGNVSQPSSARVVVDISPPMFAPTYPAAVNVVMDMADILVKITEGGTIYYYYYETEQVALTAADLKNAGSAIEVAGGVENRIELTDLNPNTPYYAYLAIEDVAGNLHPDVSSITFETSAFGIGD